MATTFDGKSALVGGVIGALVVAAFGATQVASPPIGRFRIEAAGGGSGRADAYVIDTATGQVWSERTKEFHLSKIGD